MGKPDFYVAPCWSAAHTLTDHSQGEKKHFVIALFGEELDLADGLALMDDRGWRLLRYTHNTVQDGSCLSNMKHPDYYYLFVRAEQWGTGWLAGLVNVTDAPGPTPPPK